ncbi:MAG TPA: hypothetical protein VFO40_03320 [Chthoniobacterales bacterium]|nr:hypothetical protein [Chthoniobacterales bacterium]
MPNERKSPQQKKQLEYARDHFSGGFNSARDFHKGWRRKKARVNRQYRRKSDELLASVKPGLDAGDAEVVSEDITAPRFQKSVSRKRLKKIGVITMGERVKCRLQRRDEAVKRRVLEREYYDHAAAQAVKTLESMSDEKLLAVVNRMQLLLKGNVEELTRVLCSRDPLDQALRFLRAVNIGSARELDALRRNPELCWDFRKWIQKPDRIMAKAKRAQEKNQQEKEAARQRRKEFRKG